MHNTYTTYDFTFRTKDEFIAFTALLLSKDIAFISVFSTHKYEVSIQDRKQAEKAVILLLDVSIECKITKQEKEIK